MSSAERSEWVWRDHSGEYAHGNHGNANERDRLNMCERQRLLPHPRIVAVRKVGFAKRVVLVGARRAHDAQSTVPWISLVGSTPSLRVPLEQPSKTPPFSRRALREHGNPLLQVHRYSAQKITSEARSAVKPRQALHKQQTLHVQ